MENKLLFCVYTFVESCLLWIATLYTLFKFDQVIFF